MSDDAGENHVRKIKMQCRRRNIKNCSSIWQTMRKRGAYDNRFAYTQKNFGDECKKEDLCIVKTAEIK